MVKETSHSEATAAALAKDLGKRLHTRDHQLEKKAARDKKRTAATLARIKAGVIWMQAKRGNLPEDVSALAPQVRTQIVALGEEEMARSSVILEREVAMEKNVAEYLSSPESAKLAPDRRAMYEAQRNFYEQTVRIRKDRLAQLLLILTMLDHSKRAEMVKETSHSEATAAALAKDLGKRLHIRDHKLEKKVARDKKRMAATLARIKAGVIWMQAKRGNLPEDVFALAPQVRTEIVALGEEEMARSSVILEREVALEKNVAEYLSSPESAKLTPDRRAMYEAERNLYEQTVRMLKDRLAQLLLILTMLDHSKE